MSAGPCFNCGSARTLKQGNVRTCMDCHQSEVLDALRTCTQCGGRMVLRSSTREGDWRLQMAVCDTCDHRQLVESRIVRTAKRRFKRGQGFDAEVARRRSSD